MMRAVLCWHLMLISVHVQCYRTDSAAAAAAAAEQPLPNADKYTLQEVVQMLSRTTDQHSTTGAGTADSVAYRNEQPSYSWLKMMGSATRNKRSLASTDSLQQQALVSATSSSQLAIRNEEELRQLLAEAFRDMDGNDLLLNEDLLNAPLSELDMHLIQYSPLMKLIRILYYIQVKRQQTYNPRLGRRSALAGGGEECNEFQQRSPYSAARCMGKKDMQYTPRLGRRSG